MTRGGRGVDSGRGRASPSTRGWRGSPDVGRGGTSVYLRGGTRGRGRGVPVRGGSSRGRGRGGILMPDQPAEIDARVADNSDKALVALSRSGGTASDLGGQPLRPDFGTAGREIKLRTNFFPVQIAPGEWGQDRKVFAYEVAITPAVGLRRVRKRIYDLAERTTVWARAGMVGTVVYDDSARLFSASLLPQPVTIRVPYYNDGERGPPRDGGHVYTLSIIFVQEINIGHLTSYLMGHSPHYNPSPAIAAMNLIVRYLPSEMGITVGSKRYFVPSITEPFRLGGGVEAWKGINASVRPTYKQLMIRVDVCTSPFYTPGNLAYTMNALQNVALCARTLRFVRVEATHLGCRKMIAYDGIATDTANTYLFDTPDYGLVTVEDYFRRKYNIRLQYPDLRLVRIGRQSANNYLPAEVCEIPLGQPFRGKLTDEQATAMITAACRPPNAHGQTTITQHRHQFGLDVIRPELESFGITIGPDMAVIPGRILVQPGITYASNTTVSTGDHASWNLIGVKFAVGARLENWAVLVVNDGPQTPFGGASDLREVVSAFRAMCNASGMIVPADPTYATAQLPPWDFADPIRHEAIQTIRSTLLNVRPKPTLVLVILANQDNAIYEGVKHLCDVRLDVATVCVQASKICRRNPHYLANMALKANMKLGGVNHKLGGDAGEWLKRVRTMVVGIDVTHPSPGSLDGCPSLAAVVASVDNDFAQYPVGLDIQSGWCEMIMNLKNMMVDRLKLFQKKNDRKLPERILIYRSGASESHFKQIREMECPSIMEAFKAISPGESYRSKFTIVVCCKSRHVRFYPTERDDATVEGNPLPGTIVDRGITAIYDFDFYLQSHGRVQGTARPTHYYVIYDEIKFNADQIQGVTNALSYMFARATQAVSVPSPVYYADLACKRGRCYLRKMFHGYVGDGGTTVSETQTESQASQATGQDVMEEARRAWGWGVAGAGLRETMFYI